MIKLNLPVHSIAHARAGDKGDVSNISLIAYLDSGWPIIEKLATKNNLIAPKNELIGFEEYYIPDGSFNAYFLDKEKWNYEKDIDIKNNIKIKKNKKIKKGLFPK